MVHINDPGYKRKSHIEIGEIFFWTATIKAGICSGKKQQLVSA